jgi:hypothetical protein
MNTQAHTQTTSIARTVKISRQTIKNKFKQMAENSRYKRNNKIEGLALEKVQEVLNKEVADLYSFSHIPLMAAYNTCNALDASDWYKLCNLAQNECKAVETLSDRYMSYKKIPVNGLVFEMTEDLNKVFEFLKFYSEDRFDA